MIFFNMKFSKTEKRTRKGGEIKGSAYLRFVRAGGKLLGKEELNALISAYERFLEIFHNIKPETYKNLDEKIAKRLVASGFLKARKVSVKTQLFSKSFVVRNECLDIYMPTNRGNDVLFYVYCFRKKLGKGFVKGRYFIRCSGKKYLIEKNA